MKLCRKSSNGYNMNSLMLSIGMDFSLFIVNDFLENVLCTFHPKIVFVSIYISIVHSLFNLWYIFMSDKTQKTVCPKIIWI